MPRYKVVVDDNFHYQDAGHRRDEGSFERIEDALRRCRDIVERSIREEWRPGISAEALYERYTSFGEDPFIVVLDGADPQAAFSAWTYAKERCEAMCSQGPAKDPSAIPE